jgi:hypothetical protein
MRKIFVISVLQPYLNCTDIHVMHGWRSGCPYRRYNEEKPLLPLVSIEPNFLARPARILVTIPTEMFLLHGLLIMRVN